MGTVPARKEIPSEGECVHRCGAYRRLDHGSYHSGGGVRVRRAGCSLAGGSMAGRDGPDGMAGGRGAGGGVAGADGRSEPGMGRPARRRSSSANSAKDLHSQLTCWASGRLRQSSTDRTWCKLWICARVRLSDRSANPGAGDGAGDSRAAVAGGTGSGRGRDQRIRLPFRAISRAFSRVQVPLDRAMPAKMPRSGRAGQG